METIYKIGAGITGTILFIGVWIYAVSSWGFLVGISLGWIPAFITAALGAALWPLIIGFIIDIWLSGSF